MLGQRRFGKIQTAVLVVIALVMAANLISPAVGHVTRKLTHLYKHLDPRYVNVGEQAASAANADKLDNFDSGDFQKKTELLFAVVNNAGSATATLVRGRGATGVSAFLVTDVSFNRAVNNCSWTATADPTADAQTFATVEPGTDNNTVRVTLWSDAGALIVGAGEMFHLTVVC
jgi:hypothetical protein